MAVVEPKIEAINPDTPHRGLILSNLNQPLTRNIQQLFIKF